MKPQYLTRDIMWTWISTIGFQSYLRSWESTTRMSVVHWGKTGMPVPEPMKMKQNLQTSHLQEERGFPAVSSKYNEAGCPHVIHHSRGHHGSYEQERQKQQWVCSKPSLYCGLCVKDGRCSPTWSDQPVLFVPLEDHQMVQEIILNLLNPLIVNLYLLYKRFGEKKLWEPWLQDWLSKVTDWRSSWGNKTNEWPTWISFYLKGIVFLFRPRTEEKERKTIHRTKMKWATTRSYEGVSYQRYNFKILNEVISVAKN